MYPSKLWLIPLFFIGMGFVAVTTNYLVNSHEEQAKDLIATGDKIINKCKLLEVNIDNGWFTTNTNKLDCDGIVINIPIDIYSNAVNSYKESVK